MRVLFTTYEGGGHVPPALLVAQALTARGAQVLLVSDEATRPAARRAGLAFEPWRRAPNRTEIGSAADPLEDWRARTPGGVVRAICEAVMCRPALAYARDTLDIVERFRPDIVVSQELLFGVFVAAEARGVPLALLTGNLWCFPTREDLPPFGPAFPAARGRLGHERDRWTRNYIAGLYDAGLGDLNAARAAIGLAPLRRTLDQLAIAKRILLGTSQTFDFGAEVAPAPFHYVGPLFHVPEWATGAPPAVRSEQPLVLVSFSTTFQAQAKVISRCVRALAGLPVRGIVTLGPAVQPGEVASAPHVEVVASASHDEIMPWCAAMICHGGHGTVLRPLMHGVPMLCLPMGRDQPENAVRIVSRGAGLKLGSRAGPRAIRRAVLRLLNEPSFRQAAAALGAAISQEADGGRLAADLILSLSHSGSLPPP